MTWKKIKLTDPIVDDIALYLGRQYLLPGRPGVATYPPRANTMDAWFIVTAVLSHPDAAGLFTDEEAPRATQELPTEDGAVIVPADGHDYIEARVYNKTYRAREAGRHWTGGWHAAWRSGSEVRGIVGPGEIAPGTWRAA